jgi:hypothetical protein
VLRSCLHPMVWGACEDESPQNCVRPLNLLRPLTAISSRWVRVRQVQLTTPTAIISRVRDRSFVRDASSSWTDARAVHSTGHEGWPDPSGAPHLHGAPRHCRRRHSSWMRSLLGGDLAETAPPYGLELLLAVHLRAHLCGPGFAKVDAASH